MPTNPKWLLLSFKGRASRKSYWSVFLFLMGVSAIYFTAASLLSSRDGGANAWVIGLLALIPLFWINFAIQVKRLHDLDKTGWLVLVNFIPYVGGLIMLIWLGFFKGTPGPNRFGDFADVPPLLQA